MVDYLYSSKKLYRHSQQGWENLNHLLKTFYFRITARGGAGNLGKRNKDWLLLIARWMQCRLCIACGLKDCDLADIAVGDNVEGEEDDVHAI
jgi:hypothetical protein